MGHYFYNSINYCATFFKIFRFDYVLFVPSCYLQQKQDIFLLGNQKQIFTLVVCLIILSKFGLVLSLFFLVQTEPTSSDGLIILYRSNSRIVSCRANSTGCRVSIPNSSSFCVKCHSIGWGGSSKANLINLWVSGSAFLCTIFKTLSTHLRMLFPLTESKKLCSFSSKTGSLSKS